MPCEPGHFRVTRKSNGRKGVTLVTQKRGVCCFGAESGVESQQANIAAGTPSACDPSFVQ